MEQLKIEIYGSVQGVGFRSFVKRNADELGIKGYVRNSDDGSVLVIAQGDEKILGVFLDKMKEGPGQVREIKHSFENIEKSFRNFIMA